MKNTLGFTLVLQCTLLVSCSLIYGQKPMSGPVIKDYGAVYAVPNTDVALDTAHTLKAVFDIMHSPEDPSALNKSMETVARFYNMHAQNGFPLSKLKVAMVVHNNASKDIMVSDAYRKKYGTNNPNETMIAQLLQRGTQIIFCGQSSYARNIPKADLMPGVQLSLSAMTALITLQNENYRLIKF